jgi:hypothetical protein
VSLRDGFVLHDFGRYKDPTNLSGAREPSALRMFNNTACQETAQVPISAFLGLLAAPGVVLALRQDMSNLRTVLVEGLLLSENNAAAAACTRKATPAWRI